MTGPQPAPTVQRPCPFGPRDRVLVTLLAEGLTFEEIGARLRIAPSTVHRRTWKLVRRAGCRNRIDLVATALRNAWIR